MNMIHDEGSILPISFRVQLECQVFMNRVNKTLGSSLEESNGVPRELVRMFEDEWVAARARIVARHTGKQYSFLVLIPLFSFCGAS
jgi:transcriptional regulatory protein LEU3